MFLKRIAPLICLSAAVVSRSTAAADDGGDELAKLAGAWSFKQVVVDGKEQPVGSNGNDRLVFQKGGQFAVIQQRVTRGTIKIIPGKTPQRYEVTFTTGIRKGGTVPVSYEIAGDTLTICMPLRDTDAPASLESKPGQGRMLQVLKRETKDVKDALRRAARLDLTGVWQARTYTLDGKPTPADDLKKVQLHFDASGRSQALNDGKLFLASTTQLDPTTDPASIDITFTEGKDKGKTALGIYKIEDDTLTICRSAPGQPRPTEFASKPAGGLTLMTYQHNPTPRMFRGMRRPN